MKYFLIFFFTFFLTNACVQKQRLPAGVLPRPKMAEVMWNLIKVDEYINNYVMKDSTRNKKKESFRLYEQVFSLLGTSSDQFKKSMNYYQEHPEQLKVVMDSLRSYESKGMREMSLPPAIPDSVKRLIKTTIPAAK